MPQNTQESPNSNKEGRSNPPQTQYQQLDQEPNSPSKTPTEDEFCTKHISCVPEWNILNEFIEDGYRAGYTTYFDHFLSIFKWHNETMSIWTHLLAALFFGYMLVTHYTQWRDNGLIDYKMESFSKYGLLDNVAGQKDMSIYVQIFNSGSGMDLLAKLINRYNGQWEPDFHIFWNGMNLDLSKLYNFLSQQVRKYLKFNLILYRRSS